MAIYEFPFNERIRTLLRLEDLFSKVLLNIASEHPSHHHNAIVSFFQILDILDRTDLKIDLLQELDRQKVIMASLVGNPNTAAVMDSCAVSKRPSTGSANLPTCQPTRPTSTACECHGFATQSSSRYRSSHRVGCGCRTGRPARTTFSRQ